MRWFSFSEACRLLVVIFLAILVCGEIELRQIAASDRSVHVVDHAKIFAVNSSVRVLIFDDNLSNDAAACVHCCCLKFWGYIRVKYCCPYLLRRDQFDVDPWSWHPTEMTSKNTYIAKIVDIDRYAFTKISYRIIPVQSSCGEIVFGPERNISLFWYVGERQDGTLVDTKISFLPAQLSLHSAQLKPEDDCSDGGEYGCGNRAEARDFSPKGHAAGYVVLFFLFASALVCCLSANYLDEKWPSATWIPLVIFALIAAIW